MGYYIFSKVIQKNRGTYRVVLAVLSETTCRDLLMQNPYDAFVNMNENLEEGEEPLLKHY